MATKKKQVTLAEFEGVLKSGSSRERYNAIFDFSKSAIPLEALPVLRGALKDSEPGVVRYAAVCLGKLGAAAKVALWELRVAAATIDPPTELPQSYEHCLEAILKIDATDPLTLDLIQNHIGLSNWYPLKASLMALKTIGTDEALDLLSRAVTFWMPDLDKKQQRMVQEIAGKK